MGRFMYRPLVRGRSTKKERQIDHEHEYQHGRRGKDQPETYAQFAIVVAAGKFSKISAIVHLLYRDTVE